MSLIPYLLVYKGSGLSIESVWTLSPFFLISIKLAKTFSSPSSLPKLCETTSDVLRVMINLTPHIRAHPP